VGNADPRALQVAVSTLQAFELIGLPEGRIPIAQCITYLATAPKSNRSYVALHKALGAVKNNPGVAVPKHLRNAPTQLMKDLDYGRAYRYAHDEADAFAAGENYWPDGMKPPVLYEPVERGLEIKIAEKMRLLRDKNAQAKKT
jgi:putative ATPase